MKKHDTYIQFQKLNSYKNISHLFTKKPFDITANPNKQYDKIKNILNIKPRKILKMGQKHTNIVKKIDENNLNSSLEGIDGLITNLKEVGLVTYTADCQPIFLYDTQNNVIGNIHSGWQGTLNKILKNAISLMITEYNSNPQNIEIYIGPSIKQCCFEVDEDIKEKFEKNFKSAQEKYITKGQIKEGKQKYYIDTIKLNIEIAKSMGVLEKNIYTSNICTKCQASEFHSHRGEKNAGRDIAFIILK